MTDSQRWLILISILLLAGLVYLLSPILTPFLIAALLAYLFNPIVTRLASWHVPRIAGVIIVFLILIVIAFGLIFFIIPLLEKQIVNLLHYIPKLNAWLNTTVWPWLDRQFNITEQIDVESMKALLVQYLPAGGGLIAKFWKVISHSGQALIEFLMNIVLIPVVGFYLLRDWRKITHVCCNLLPRHLEQKILLMINECGDVLAAFFHGQFLVMLSLAVIYSTGLALVGLDIGILIGAVIGLLSIVPYLGFALGFLMAMTAGVVQFHHWTHLVLIALVFVIGQISEGWVLVPWLVGNRIGIHPVAIIFAVLAFGKLFGFIGVLLALPVSAVIMVFLRHLRAYYIGSQYYSRG